MIKFTKCLPAKLTPNLLWVFAAIILLSACTSTKRSTYFASIKSDTTIKGFVTDDFESTIRPGDQLSIVVTSLSSIEDQLFNSAAATSLVPELGGFKVYEDGTVLLHKLGKVTAAGLTRKALAEKLQTDLLTYMRDPIVNVGYLNHKVTVMGAVGGPQVLNMPQEQMSIIDLLVKSGDINDDGMKSKVMIIREEGTDKKIKYLDLEDASIFTNPWFYVQPNDIVYVPTDNTKLEKLEKRTQFQSTLALTASAISFLIIILDRVIK